MFGRKCATIKSGARFSAGRRGQLSALAKWQEHLSAIAVQVNGEDPSLERYDDAPRLLVPHAWPEDDAPTAFLTGLNTCTHIEKCCNGKATDLDRQLSLGTVHIVLLSVTLAALPPVERMHLGGNRLRPLSDLTLQKLVATGPVHFMSSRCPRAATPFLRSRLSSFLKSHGSSHCWMKVLLCLGLVLVLGRG